MSAPDCRCGEPSFGRCAYCRRPVCLDCADPHDAVCAKRPRDRAGAARALYASTLAEIDAKSKPRVIPGAAVATEDAL